MRFLILGGTAWLGGQLTSTALTLGHEVTCLARGTSGDAPDGAVFVPADRTLTGAYDQIAGERWDVVIDVSRQPGQVKSAVAALADHTGFFVFVSSGNVYARHDAPGQDEGGALLPALAGDVMESMETYGHAKVACEQHVLRAFGPDPGADRPCRAHRWSGTCSTAPATGRCGLPDQRPWTVPSWSRTRRTYRPR